MKSDEHPIGWGLVTGSRLLSRSSAPRQARRSCSPVAGPGSERCAEALDTLDGGDTLSTAGIVTLGVGGGLLIAGIIYLVVPDTSAPSEKMALGFVPWMTPQGGGLVIRGGF